MTLRISRGMSIERPSVSNPRSLETRSDGKCH
jgi:hypothetical protein